MARLPIYYYCTRSELEALGWDEEPGVPEGSDISDPRLLQTPTIFLKPGEPPRGMQDIDTAFLEARLAAHDAATEARRAAQGTQSARAKDAAIDALLSDPDLVDPTVPPPAPPSPAPEAATPPAPYTPPPFPSREHGWTMARQSQFLAAIAEGYTVEAACRMVGLSVNSAYKLRRSAAGATFALGWNGALLIHRGALADSLLSRAHDGQEVIWTKADGQETRRHFFDNRLGLAMLTRLDRIAEAQKAEGADHAAQLVAQDFDAFLDMMRKGGSPARAGLFLARRTALELPEDYDDEDDVPVAEAAAALWSSPQLAPVAALARADLYTRTGASLPQEIDVRDLDYDKRADWTAEQWQRAHASGLISFGSPSPFGSSAVENTLRAEREASTSLGSNSRQARTEREGDWYETEYEPHNRNPNPPKPRPATGTEGRVWFDHDAGVFLTNFPPADTFTGEEDVPWGHPAYERGLSIEEYGMLTARHERQIRDISAPDAELRDRWFAGIQSGETDVLPIFAQQYGIEEEVEAADPIDSTLPEPAEAQEESVAAEAILPPNRKSRRTAAARRRTRRKGDDAAAESAHAA